MSNEREQFEAWFNFSKYTQVVFADRSTEQIAWDAWQFATAKARAEMGASKDAAYLERNRVVAALAKCFPSGTARTAIEGWSEDWHGCVYIDLPTGQASWHYHDSQAYLFADLPPYTKPWDGHTTEQKYERLAALSAPPAVPGGKYSEVLIPFVALMEQELHVNAGKGDRPGWMKCTPETLILEVYYHTAKLAKAVRDGNVCSIREYAADTANMAMMVLDRCDETFAAAPQPAEPQEGGRHG